MVALSFDSAASPNFTLGGFDRCAEGRAYGWGFAWYPEQSGAALVVKDATSVGENAMTKLLREWERFESTTFVAHLRGAARILAEQDTHPFSRTHAGRDWVFAHNGDLDSAQGYLSGALSLGERPVHEPIGRTDSEHAFCWLLNRAWEAGARTLADVGWPRLHEWLSEVDGLGTANIILSDGRDLVAYADAEGYNGLHVARLLPPNVPKVLRAKELSVGLQDARDRTRTAVVFSTVPLGDVGFKALRPGQMLAVRRAAFIYDSSVETSSSRLMVPPIDARAPSNEPSSEGQRPAADQLQAEGSGAGPSQEATSDIAVESKTPATNDVGPSADTPTPAPATNEPSFYTRELAGRVLAIEHRTTYNYRTAVERSSHLFRLHPVHGRRQELLDFELDISVEGLVRGYEDVFGNWVVRADVETPFTELVVSAKSVVRVHQRPADLDSPHRRFNIPLVWMPWQRQMMTPYLLPPELPESQLRELSDFAMSFVERQDYDLVQTLLDINTTLYRDFSYVSGSTTMATTPFEVFLHRRGVCQDFANLLICMARLLGVPARYRMGYIFTGGRYENEIQSDASHAWAELYLPWFGWQGFDPTNGVLVNDDHVLVACGRNYGDATPTSGTLYKGGDDETLRVDVRVEESELGSSGS